MSVSYLKSSSSLLRINTHTITIIVIVINSLNVVFLYADEYRKYKSNKFYETYKGIMIISNTALKMYYQ